MGKVHVNVGTIGHVDHGKTTLTAAITKVMAVAPLFDEEPALADRTATLAKELAARRVARAENVVALHHCSRVVYCGSFSLRTFFPVAVASA